MVPVPGVLGVEPPFGEWIPVVFFGLPPFFVIGALAFAIFYDGALDPSLVVRRTTVYSVLAALLTFLFTGVEELVEAQIAERTALPGGLGTWVAAGGVALVVGAFQARVRSAVGRAVGGEGVGTSADDGHGS